MWERCGTWKSVDTKTWFFHSFFLKKSGRVKRSCQLGWHAYRPPCRKLVSQAIRDASVQGEFAPSEKDQDLVCVPILVLGCWETVVARMSRHWLLGKKAQMCCLHFPGHAKLFRAEQSSGVTKADLCWGQHGFQESSAAHANAKACLKGSYELAVA